MKLAETLKQTALSKQAMLKKEAKREEEKRVSQAISDSLIYLEEAKQKILDETKKAAEQGNTRVFIQCRETMLPSEQEKLKDWIRAHGFTIVLFENTYHEGGGTPGEQEWGESWTTDVTLEF